jgi:hypothetical protein
MKSKNKITMEPIKNITTKLTRESSIKPSPVSGRTLQLIIGILAMSLPTVLIVGAAIIDDCQLVQNSISAYYHTVMRNFFVGTLCGVAISMFAYYGYHKYDNWLANAAAVFALGVAFFPTSVGDPVTDCIEKAIDTGICNTFHFISAASLFVILAIFSLVLFRIKGENPSQRKLLRNKIYLWCGIIILACIVMIGVLAILPGDFGSKIGAYRPVFYLEALALGSFSISWLTKSEFII